MLGIFPVTGHLPEAGIFLGRTPTNDLLVFSDHPQKRERLTVLLTLGQAARETGKSKSVIATALKKGRLSGRRGDNGDWQIDPAELFRVFPQAQPQEPRKERDSTLQDALIELLREQVREAKEREQQARQERDRLLAMLEAEQQARRDLEIRLLPAPIKAKKKGKKN